MTVNRTTLLDLPLPVTGTESGTWGDTTNNGLTQYMDIAVAGMNSLTSANFTAGALTLANTTGDSSATNIAAGSAQYATIKVSSLAVNSTITAPSSNRSYRIINADATYSLTIKASGQTGVTFLPGQTGVVAFNGTDYVIVGVVGAGTATDNAVARFDGTTGKLVQNSVVTIADSTGDISGVGQLNATTVDTTNIEVTNIKAKDGTAAASIADSTGVISITSNPVLSGGTANGVLYLNGSKAVSSGSALVFDGANLGLGVTPSVYTANSRVFQVDGGANAAEIKLTNNTSGASGATGAIFQMTGNDLYIWNSENSFLSLGTNNTERARIDSSGNLGLGVTPSAWFSGYKVLQLNTNGAIYSNTDFMRVSNNAYVDASAVDRYLTNGYAFMEVTAASNGSRSWFTAPSGTAGNAITFTQAMTLDASGNLNLGMTGGGGRLNIGNSAGTNGQVDLYVRNLTSGTAMGLIKTGSSYSYAGVGANTSWLYSQGTDTLTLGADGAAPITFVSNGAERARITSGGDLLVGTTSNAQGSGDGNKLIAGGAVWVVNAATADGFSYYNSSAAAYRFYVSSAGTISATNTTISAISDQRFKENIQDLDVGLDKIMALKPRKFDWKAGKGKDIKDDRGFIAQEFEQVFPDLIDEWKDPAPEGEQPYKSVRQDLIPVLVKAIQEQQALIESLTSRVAQLEGTQP